MASRPKIRLGAFNVGEYTFWGYWGDALSYESDIGAPLFNIEVTCCWDVNQKLSRDFADKYGCEPVESYDDMLGKVDAIAFGGFYEVPWQHRIAQPYIEAGLPVYLSRPFAYTLKDIDWVLELAAKHGSSIMATSVFEHFYQANYLKSRLPNLGEIQSVHGLCGSTEYPAHFHIQWFLYRIFGYDVDKVSLITDDEREAKYLQETILFKGNDEQPPFLASLHANTQTPHLQLTASGSKATESVEMNRSPEPKETLYHYFSPQMMDMQSHFMGQEYQPPDIIRKKTQIFLAAYYSHLEKNGAMVPLDIVPTDWSPRYFKDGWIDESMFKG